MMPLDTHDAIVNDWKANAQDHDDENFDFLRSLKRRSSKKVDRIALELHQEVFQIVDCTRCANCCRTMRIVITDEDIPRIAGHLGSTTEEFIARYLELDKQERRYLMKATPCPFLGDNSRCTIYDVRPEKCRGYPFTDKPDFSCMSMTHATNAVTCPAVFAIVEGMKKRIR
jgi:uncharacterized protein